MASSPEGLSRSLAAPGLRPVQSQHRPGHRRTSRYRWPVSIFVVVLGIDLASPSAMTADSIRAISVAPAMTPFWTISPDRFRPLPNAGYAITMSHGHLYPLFPWAVS